MSKAKGKRPRRQRQPGDRVVVNEAAHAAVHEFGSPVVMGPGGSQQPGVGLRPFLGGRFADRPPLSRSQLAALRESEEYRVRVYEATPPPTPYLTNVVTTFTVLGKAQTGDILSALSIRQTSPRRLLTTLVDGLPVHLNSSMWRDPAERLARLIRNAIRQVPGIAKAEVAIVEYDGPGAAGGLHPRYPFAIYLTVFDDFWAPAMLETITRDVDGVVSSLLHHSKAALVGTRRVRPPTRKRRR
jgi:hypothetical protein